MRLRIEEIRRPFEKHVKAAYPAASTPTIGEFNRLNVRSLTILTMAYNDKSGFSSCAEPKEFGEVNYG